MAFLITLAAALWSFILFTYITYYFTFRSPNIINSTDDIAPSGVACKSDAYVIRAIVRENNALPSEAVSIVSHDGLKLNGRYYHRADGAPLIIAFHGYRGCAMRDRCCDMIVTRTLGYNLLLADMRSHGKSDGKATTFGIKERFDCRDWAIYAAERFGKDADIYLDGVSMGATSVLMAGALGIPENVRGIIADSPYDSPEGVIKQTCKKMKLDPETAFPAVKLSAKLYGGFNICEYSATEAVAVTSIPILLICGDNDRICPCDMGKRIAQANPEKVHTVSFCEAGHGLAYLSDPRKYEAVIRSFVEAHCAKRAS